MIDAIAAAADLSVERWPRGNVLEEPRRVARVHCGREPMPWEDSS